MQLRHDHIDSVGLYHTVAHTRVGTVREDAVDQCSGAVHAQNETSWTTKLRSLSGLRVDGYRFDVVAGNPANGGLVRSAIVSPKARRSVSARR